MELQETKTGEYTIFIPSMNETYHSRNGAISESKHVFIEEGMNRVTFDTKILEIGFGTGLNAILTGLEALKQLRHVEYHTLEPFPIPSSLIDQLKYGEILEDEKLFDEIHDAEWEQAVDISDYFSLHKTTQKLEYIQLKDNNYDVIYFDAFAPKKQEELWTPKIYKKLYDSLKPDGVLSTYSAAGQLKRDLKSVGFRIENPPGANGKREMTVAIKA